MPAGRRHPPPLPHLSALVPKPTGPQGKQTPESIGVMYNGLLNALRKQEEFNRSLLDGFSGLPRPHAETHLVGKSDPLQTPGTPLTVLAGGAASIGTGPSFMRENAQLIVGVAVPANPTGQTAAVGSAFTVLRSDATIKQGIVTTKGDLLTHSATLPDRLPVGADGLALVAASGQPLGLQWAAPTAAAHNLLSTVHGDTVANAPLRGALVVGNSTPAWARLAIGAADRVLFSDGTDVSWAQVTTGAITDAAVTYAKIQDVSAASRLLGRGDSGAGDVQEITLGSGLSMSGTTLSASGGGGGGPWTNTGALVHLVTASDEVSIGDASAIDTAENKLEVLHGIAAKRYSAVANEPPIFAGYRARGSFGAETALGNGDTVLSIRAWGSGNGGYVLPAEIRVVATGTFDLGSALAPARMDFYVDDGSGLGAQVRLRLGGAGGILGGVLTGVGTQLGVLEVATDLSLATAALSAKTAFDSHAALESLAISRMRPDGTAPNADFGSDIGWWLQGANDDLVRAARERVAWEVNQTDDTTARDSYYALYTMVNNALTERLRVTSAGVVQPGADNVGDMGTSALRWKDIYIARVRGGVAGTASGILNAAANAAGVMHYTELAESAANPMQANYHRARGTVGGESDVSAADGLVDFGFFGRRSGAYSEGARLSVAIETITNQLTAGFTFYTRPDIGMGGNLNRRLYIGSGGDVAVGNGTGPITSSSATGFFGIPIISAAGATPSGAPSTYGGSTAPSCYDASADIHWIYDGTNWNAH